MKKMLIAYYTWSNGNTERIARALRAATGADAVRIETEVPYPDDYATVVEQGRREVEAGYQPAIRPLPVRLADYDVIAVGTPTWWYTMAPAVRSFLQGQDWAGRTVVPFMTNGGWPGHVIQDMAQICGTAQIACPMEIRFDSNGGNQMETPQAEVDAWTAAVCGMLND